MCSIVMRRGEFVILNKELITQWIPAPVYSLASAIHSSIIIIHISRAPSMVIPLPLILFPRRSSGSSGHMILFPSLATTCPTETNFHNQPDTT